MGGTHSGQYRCPHRRVLHPDDKARVTAAGARSLRDQLDHLHNMDIAHGDLFPRNIMGSNDGRAFLVDFSSAKLFPHSSFMLRKREDFLDYTRGEKCVLELLLFRLQQNGTKAWHFVQPRVRNKHMVAQCVPGQVRITLWLSLYLMSHETSKSKGILRRTESTIHKIQRYIQQRYY
ncbi:hypothetical protein EMCG_00250 [[Emmonsia] crescens]|uniref:Protein kinase domain-containing protein n=1 Tax=[Emmonsia] crescens TaxID=73230 RepID=A0A0G2J996_9EURO|nr:hypothetical protein EMCG_00250 [Emmonsia crescens UAMH 3008]